MKNKVKILVILNLIFALVTANLPAFGTYLAVSKDEENFEIFESLKFSVGIFIMKGKRFLPRSTGTHGIQRV